MLGYFDAQDGRPKIMIEIKGTKRKVKQLPALFDTGHNGSLSLPVLELINIGAKLSSIGEVEFADGISRTVYYFSVKVIIDGKEKEVEAAMINNPKATEAIAGTELFSPFIALVDFKNKLIKFVSEEELNKK